MAFKYTEVSLGTEKSVFFYSSACLVSAIWNSVFPGLWHPVGSVFGSVWDPLTSLSIWLEMRLRLGSSNLAGRRYSCCNVLRLARR